MVKSEESFDTSKDSVHFKSFNLNNSIFVSNQSKLMNENMFNNNKEKMIKIPMESEFLPFCLSHMLYRCFKEPKT